MSCRTHCPPADCIDVPYVLPEIAGVYQKVTYVVYRLLSVIYVVIVSSPALHRFDGILYLTVGSSYRLVVIIELPDSNVLVIIGFLLLSEIVLFLSSEAESLYPVGLEVLDKLVGVYVVKAVLLKAQKTKTIALINQAMKTIISSMTDQDFINLSADISTLEAVLQKDGLAGDTGMEMPSGENEDSRKA